MIEILRAHIPPDVAVEPSFAAELSRAWEAARGAWPEVDVAFERFAPLLARELARDREEGLSTALARLHVGDLYLACACASGDAAALRAVERYCGPAIADVVRRVHASPELRDETLQVTRELLFAPRPDRPPKVERYSGRGDLRSWTMVVAAREAVRLGKARSREQSRDPDALLDLAGTDDDPELAYMKRAYTTQFEDALRDALVDLGPRERTVLKYHYVDGLTGKRIASIYGVHPATVTRWLEGARIALASTTRALLERRLGATDREVESLERLVQSQLTVSLARHLGGVRP